MIKFNFGRIFNARGISKPYSFLLKAGFSNGFAYKVSNDRVKNIRNKELEKLCLLLVCTPEDFMEWEPDKGVNVDKDHPLYELQKTDDIFDITKSLRSVPMDRLEEIYEHIQKMLNEEEKSG